MIRQTDVLDVDFSYDVISDLQLRESALPAGEPVWYMADDRFRKSIVLSHSTSCTLSAHGLTVYSEVRIKDFAGDEDTLLFRTRQDMIEYLTDNGPPDRDEE